MKAQTPRLESSSTKQDAAVNNLVDGSGMPAAAAMSASGHATVQVQSHNNFANAAASSSQERQTALSSHGYAENQESVPQSITNQGALNDPMKAVDTMTSSSKKKDNHNIQLDGPLHGAIKKKVRDNRDMSEGLEKSRSHKLGGLVSMIDN